VKIYPIIVQACYIQAVPWLTKMNIRPRDARALALYPRAKRDDVMASLAAEIRNIVRTAKAEKPVIEAQPYEGIGAEPAAAARSALGSIVAAGYAAPRVELNPEASESAEPFSLVWNVPYARNLQFTGRSEVIVQLETELNSGPAAAVTQAIAGLGGIGK